MRSMSASSGRTAPIQTPAGLPPRGSVVNAARRWSVPSARSAIWGVCGEPPRANGDTTYRRLPAMVAKPGRSVAALLVECLATETCEYVFSVPGEETMDILEALSEQTAVRHVTTRHEQGAA